MLPKYLQVVWLYIIGLMILLVGVYILVGNPGPIAFIVMLAGLAVAAVGAAHGRKIRTMGDFDMDKLMKEGGFGDADKGQDYVTEEDAKGKVEEPVPEPEAPPMQAEVPPGEIPEPEPAPAKTGGFFGLFRRSPTEDKLRPDDVLQIEIEDIKSGRLVPTQADVIELVCPRCRAENDEKNFFCFSCGAKLRKKPIKTAEVKRRIAVAPGSISVVGDTRVAKVLICTRCDAANTQSDRFCFSCGAKLWIDGGPENREKGGRKADKEPKMKELKGKKKAK